MKVIIELSEEDGEEMVELGQQLLDVVGRLEDLEKRLEALFTTQPINGPTVKKTSDSCQFRYTI